MHWGVLTAVGVEVESAKVDGADAEVHGEVQTLAVGEGVAAVRVGGQTETLCEKREQSVVKESRSFLPRIEISRRTRELTVTNANHVLRIKRLDVRAGRLNPVVNDRGITAIAARLIGQLPRENRRRRSIPAHHSLDIVLVSSLGGGVGVPSGGTPSKGRNVSSNTTVVGPVVDKVDDQLDAVLLGRGDDVVETLQTISAGVNGGGAAGEVLEVDGARGGDSVDVVKAPDAQDAEARAVQVLHHQVDVGVVGQEADPVGVGAGKVAGLPVNGEVEAIGLGEDGGCRDCSRGCR